MALETATFVNDLNAVNPVHSTDDVGQGDDHLRLIKNVLKGTFPNATKAFYLPEVVAAKVVAYTVVAADLNSVIPVDVSGGGFTITLTAAATLGAGFVVTVIKSDSSAGVVTVDGNGGELINGVITHELVAQYQGITLYCDGANWYGVPFTDATNATVSKAVAYTAVASEVGETHICTSNFTIQLTAAATLGADWSLFISATNGAVVIDPNGSELVDGVATVTLNTGQSCRLSCNGSAFRTQFLNMKNLTDDVTPQLGGPLDTNSQPVDFSVGADVATATEALVLRGGNIFTFTGTTTVATIEDTADAFPVGSLIFVRAAGIFTLTHSANLSCLSAADITTEAGDWMVFEKYATGDWRMISYSRASGQALVSTTPATTQDLVLAHEEASGTGGGGTTAGAWYIRTVNTVKVNNITGASLASNQITLPAGNYTINMLGNFYNSGGGQYRLYDTTGAASLVVGLGTYSGVNGVSVPDGQSAPMSGYFTLSSTSVLEVQYRCATSWGGGGLGRAMGFGTETHATAHITKLV